MAFFHFWAALLLAVAVVVRGLLRWHMPLLEGTDLGLQVAASVVVYGALLFVLLRLFALPFWLLRSLRSGPAPGLRRLEAAVPVALTALCILTVELAVAWNLELPQLVALNDPVRTQLVKEALLYGGAAGLAAGVLAALFARSSKDAPDEVERSGLLSTLAPYALVLGALGLCWNYARGLDVGSLRAARAVEQDPDAAERKLAVVCVDAGMWTIVDRFVDEGRMPVLAGLRESGVRGHLVTWGQRLSPVVWTSMVTGMAERNHGIHGFTEIVGESRTPRLTRSTSRQAAALWNVTREADVSTLVLNWLVTDPPEPTAGVVVPNLKPTLAGIAPATYPEALRAGVQSIVDGRPFGSEDEESDGAHSADIVAEEMHLLETLKDVYTMTAELDDYALVVTGTQTTDGVMHQRMLHAFPEQYDLDLWGRTEAELASGADDMARSYEEADAFLGQMVDDGYTLLIVSDHGSRAQRQPTVTFSLNALLFDLGLAHQAPAVEGERRRVDTERSRAFEAGNNALESEIGLFFQPDVTADVATPSKQELLGLLRELRVVETGAPLFEGVVDLERSPVFPVLADQGAAAAVVLGSAVRELPKDRTVVVNGETKPLADYVQVLGEINGTHEPHGLFLLAGPDVAARGSIDSLCVKTSFGALLSWVIGAKPIATPAWRIARWFGLVCPYTSLDVAPTALAFLGLPVAADMDGRIMARALEGVPYTPRAVASHAELLDPDAAGAGAEPESDAAVMDMLRNLGYVR